MRTDPTAAHSYRRKLMAERVVTGDPSGIGIIAAPMHGQRKLSKEGYRTRDGHLIEWFGRICNGPVRVVSRPEPIWIPLHRYASETIARNTIPVETLTAQLPNPRNPRKWWVTSADRYPIDAFSGEAAVVTWNPFLIGSKAGRAIQPSRRVVIDLLDDWSIHYAFASVRAEVERAYRESFERADAVFANSEGTEQLARRFGRDDVRLLLNGTDPERFDVPPRQSGATTVGYVGKIGRRLDLDLILRTVDALPDFSFVFAGPILDREYRAPLASRRNVKLLGDVHYVRVPELLATFDVGWVPHRVGEGEVGGDVIKTYEYRAAGLPVLSTPVAGASSRGLDCVEVLDAEHHVEWLRSLPREGNRVRRRGERIPPEMTWRHKAEIMLGATRSW